MTKYCESCRSPNRDRASYCRGCGGKFSGIVSAATTTHEPGRKQEPPLQRPDGFPLLNAREGIVVVMLLGAFSYWYWNRPAASPRTNAATVAAAVPATRVAAPSLASSPLASAPAPAAAPALHEATSTARADEFKQADPPAKDESIQHVPLAATAPPREPEVKKAARAAPPPQTLQIRTPRWEPPPPQPFVPAIPDASPKAPPIQVATPAPGPRRGASACDGDDQALCVPSMRSRQAAPVAVPPEAAAPASSGAMASGVETRRVIVFKGEPIVVNVGDPFGAPTR
ncbi:MAG TPA: hypothetical protein VLJ19_00370 [Variovorax sp.]|nr:hypothetical protein [Variovorax sp.]